MPNKLEVKPLALTFTIWSGLFMLVLGVLANLGIYVSAAEQMAKWHIFFSPSVGGIAAGIVEAAVTSYLGVYAFVWIYNRIGIRF